MALLFGEDDFFYLLGDREFYEPPDRRKITETDYVVPVSRRLPADWTASRSRIWFYCQPRNAETPAHGWKIHVSAALADSAPILAIAAAIFIRERVPFKFAADRYLLLCLNLKRYGRGYAGKFITAYPRDESQCRELMEELRSQLAGYAGPYILSDRRFKDSSCVYYRYGAFQNLRHAGADGRLVPVMHFGDTAVVDRRLPVFRAPEGIVDPFIGESTPTSDGGESNTLNNGKYQIERVLRFANTGGVYYALDRQTSEHVLIKEARPFTGQMKDGRDAVFNLRKEYRLLSALADTGLTPRPFEFFRDWEHFYLAEEYLVGDTLARHMAPQFLPLRTRPILEDVEAFFKLYCKLYARIAEGIQHLHDRHIIIGDVSHYNVMVMKGGESVKFIDLEGAHEVGVEPHSQQFTPGFASPQVRNGEPPDFSDDRFGFGSLMLVGIFPVVDLIELDAQSPGRFLTEWCGDFGVPRAIADLIRRLHASDRRDRPTFDEVRSVLRQPTYFRKPVIRYQSAANVDLRQLVSKTLGYIESVMTFERTDRLAPASPQVFAGHPASVAFGASGIAYVLRRIRDHVDQRVIDWILARTVTCENCAPGLYTGSAGIAWALLELGYQAEAEKRIAVSSDHRLLLEDADLYYGAAGVGLTLLKFFVTTQNDMYLKRSVEIGRFLLRSRVQEGDMCWWLKQGREHSGLGHGGSGISLFLLYLFALTHEEEFLEAGRQALKRVVSNATPTPEGGLTWRLREGDSTVMPSLRWGSAGVGMVLLRYRAALSEKTYDDILWRLDLDTDRKYSIFPGRELGLAGWGEFYLDWMRFGPDPAHGHDCVLRVIAGILPFQLERNEYTAFPGESRTRISCDFASGSAGIGFFMNRFCTLGEPAFFLDELINSGTVTREAIPPHRAVLEQVPNEASR